MNKDIKYIVSKVKEYTSIPSLSYKEEKFLHLLQSDIKTNNYTKIVEKDYLLYLHNQPTHWLISTHTDRIPVPKFQFEIIDDKFVKGQLDNCISVAIVRWAIENNISINILFSTKEEILKSTDQIINVYNSIDNCWVLDMDIDVTVFSDEVKSGAISLRDKDIMVSYYIPLVEKMRQLCDKNKIDYLTKNDDWLINQIGSAIKKQPNLKGCYLGLPIDNYHSNHEIINVKCIQNVIRLLQCLSQEHKINAI